MNHLPDFVKWRWQIFGVVSIVRLPIGSNLQFTIYDCGIRSLDGVYPAFVAEVEIEVADPALDGTPSRLKHNPRNQ